MSTSEKPNLPDDDRVTPEKVAAGSYEVIRPLHEESGEGEWNGQPLELFRRETLIKVKTPRVFRAADPQTGGEGEYLESDHLIHVNLRLIRTNHKGEKFVYTETRLAACEEDGTPVPHADIYRTPTLLPVELAMSTIGEI